MFISKIKGKVSGLLLYGITPPKAHAPSERVAEIAGKILSTLSSQDIDALVVYDVQDESTRTAEERPFPFVSSLDPFTYASQHLQSLAIPKIVYRPAGNFTRHELTIWLQGMKDNNFYPIFVGLPAPDSIPKTSLKEAYSLWRHHEAESVVGAVTIPERHAILKDEDVRMLDKMASGVSYFISQCIFNVEYTKQVLDDLVIACQRTTQPVPTVIFTLTICGSVKTLQFMEWLGIHIPDDLKEEITASENPIVHSSAIAVGIAKDLIRYCQDRAIPFGFNIESVAIRKEEVEASLELLNTIRALLCAAGLRAASRKPEHQLAPGQQQLPGR